MVNATYEEKRLVPLSSTVASLTVPINSMPTSLGHQTRGGEATTALSRLALSDATNSVTFCCGTTCSFDRFTLPDGRALSAEQSGPLGSAATRGAVLFLPLAAKICYPDRIDGRSRAKLVLFRLLSFDLHCWSAYCNPFLVLCTRVKPSRLVVCWALLLSSWLADRVFLSNGILLCCFVFLFRCYCRTSFHCLVEILFLKCTSILSFLMLDLLL